MQRRQLLALAGLGLAGGVGWYATRPASAAHVTKPEERPAVDDETIQTVATDTTDFGFDVLTELSDIERTQNVAFSPLGLSLPMTVLWEGARGETADQLQDGLSHSLDRETVHEAYGAIIYDIADRAEDAGSRETPRVWEADELELGITNSLWTQEGYPIQESFLDTVADNYGPAFHEVDFDGDPDGSRDRINDWVEDSSDGHIDEALPPESIDDSTRLAVANVVYLFADWAEEFDPDDTMDDEFIAIDDTESTVQMMSQTAEFPVTNLTGDVFDIEPEDDFVPSSGQTLPGHIVVELPYVGEDVSMVIMLPQEGAFAEFERQLDAQRFTQAVEKLERSEIKFEMPRFEFETELQLSETLRQLGIIDAFELSADFDGIVDDPQFALSEVFNETVISVDETGTEAVSATIGLGESISGPTSVTCSRPFLFAIRDRPTNTILFMGRVVDAAAAQ